MSILIFVTKFPGSWIKNDREPLAINTGVAQKPDLMVKISPISKF